MKGNIIEKQILKNAVRCNLCGDVIESTHRHDFKTCSCGRVSVDGGLDYIRRVSRSRDDFTELSEFGEEITLPDNKKAT